MKMNFAHVVWLIAMSFAIVPKSIFAVSEENQRKIDELAEMTRVVMQEDLGSVQKAVAASRWSTPKIYSAAFINRLADDDAGAKRVELAKSAFGFELAKNLSRHAKLVREERESAKLELLNKPLFALVAWLGKEQGYGNQMLQARAYDIASVVAVKLVADLNYPIEKAEAAMKRFDWAWGDADNRLQVLHEESSLVYFPKPRTGNAQAAIGAEWSRLFKLAQQPINVQSHPDLWLFVFHDIPRSSFGAMPETVWQIPLHRLFLDGWGSVNLVNGADLLEFRKRHGQFPTKPKHYKKRESETEIEAAFWELSWRKPGVAGAWIAYTQYLEGTLSDEGEQQRRTAEGSVVAKQK